MSEKKSASVRQSNQNARALPNPITFLFRVIIGVGILGALILFTRPEFSEMLSSSSSDAGYETHGGITRGDAELATLFTNEVLFWQDDILRWGQERNLNPNIIAIIMQIESCGHPFISSSAGAQGLMQVMPFHFDDGENQLDPETNAYRGLNHLGDCLGWTDYDLGVSFACYNGGPSVIGRSPDQWFAESRYYFEWGTRLWADASVGASSSDGLRDWLAAGGSNLCQQAANAQDLLTSE